MLWHHLPGLVFGVFGGFAMVDPSVHVMHAIGIAMAAIFAFIFFWPWAAMRTAVAAGDAPGAALAAERVRKLVLANLVLGVATIVIAAFA